LERREAIDAREEGKLASLCQIGCLDWIHKGGRSRKSSSQGTISGKRLNRKMMMSILSLLTLQGQWKTRSRAVELRGLKVVRRDGHR
jgi:hypothetical protein